MKSKIINPGIRTENLERYYFMKGKISEKKCRDYVGVTCVNGNCPAANRVEYEEIYIPLAKRCKECFFYMYIGCEDCALAGTKYCANEI